ncbi:MAG: hypothetical protein DWQ19_12495 [Crenarchaeota archaeon]|nr:MAG: hypothetical protein DWQ19_12495 [Thermoproteota archaeon]
MPETPNPELDKILKDLQGEVAGAIDKFLNQLKGEVGKAGDRINQTVQQQAATAAPGNVPSYKSLPWFQHGVKGFLRKLWYGDHPENPTWQNVKREHSDLRILTLHEYNEIQSEVRSFLENSAFGYQVVDSMTKAAAQQLMRDITQAIATHVQKAYNLGYSRKPNKKSKADIPVSPETAPEAAPEVSPEVSPELSAEDTPAGKPPKAVASGTVRKRNKKTPPPVETPQEPEPELEASLDLQQAADKLNDIYTTTDDKKEMASVLQRAGVKIKNGKVVGSRSSNENFEKLIKIVHAMGAKPNAPIGPEDWFIGDFEKLFGVKVPKVQLDKTRMDLFRDLEAAHAEVTSHLFDTMRGRKLLKEVRSMPLAKRINFYAEALRN